MSQPAAGGDDPGGSDGGGKAVPDEVHILQQQQVEHQAKRLSHPATSGSQVDGNASASAVPEEDRPLRQRQVAQRPQASALRTDVDGSNGAAAPFPAEDRLLGQRQTDRRTPRSQNIVAVLQRQQKATASTQPTEERVQLLTYVLKAEMLRTCPLQQ